MSHPVDVSNPDSKKYLTAFVVLVTEDGTPNVVSDLEPELWFMDHKATAREVRRAVLEINADFQTQAVVDSLAPLIAVPAKPTPADLVSDALSRRSGEE